MKKLIALENLESRKLFAASLTLGPNNLYFNAVKGQSQTYQLRVNNTGDTRVLISRLAIVGDNAGLFKVIDFPAGGRSLGAGAQVNYTVRFTPGSSSDNAIKSATLRAYTNIPSKNGFSNVVPIRGLPTNGTSGSTEPSLQKIFDLYNLPIDSGDTDAETYLYPTNPSSTSDEVDVQTFVKAGTGPVTVTPIGVFTNAASPAVRMGFYTPGQRDSGEYLWYVPGDTSQSVNPFYYGITRFDPGSAAFGLLTEYPVFTNTDKTVRNVYSEKTLNDIWTNDTDYNHFRVFPFVNQLGQTVPNAYIVAQEEWENTSQADNQDLVFVVTNVRPAGDTPTISIQNRSAYPSDDAAVFNRIANPNVDVPNLVRSSNTFVVRNSGKSPLTINASVNGQYSIASGGGAATIAPGASRNIVVNFTATSGTALHYGTLTVTSNDPLTPTKAISLVGSWQQYSEQNGPGAPSVEPSAGTIASAFGYQTTMPSSLLGLDNGGSLSTFGDEVNAQYFTAADTSAAVRVVELAAYHNQTYVATNGDIVGTNSYMGYYKKGNVNSSYREVIEDKPGTGQMLLPTASNNANITAGSFNPGVDSFGFVVEKRTPDANNGGGEYSDYSLNTYNALDPANPKTEQKFLRFFPVRDSDGVLIPNTYIMVHDYNRPTTNYDFNDNLYLISNVVPEGEVKQSPTLYGVRNSNSVQLNFTSPVDGPRINSFNVYRSTTATGVYSLLTNTPIAARPSNTYTDFSAQAGTTYYYAIESVGNGSARSRRTMIEI